MQQIQLFGSGIAGKSLVVTDQRRVNCYYEIREDAEKSKVAIYGTPGQVLFAALPAIVRGWQLFKGMLIVAAGNTVYSITTNAVVTTLGTLQTAAGLVSMANNGVLLVIVDGSKCYGWDGTTFTSPLTDSNIPNGATTIAASDTFFITDTPYPTGAANGQQFNVSPSYYTVGTAWAGLAVGFASATPDPLIAVDVDHGFLILWNKTSIQFQQDAGTSPLTYAALPSATAQVGLAAKFSRAKFNNTMAFLGTNLQGGYSVYVLYGFQPQVISSKDIDAYFDDFSTVADATAISYMWDGHPFYVLTFPTAGRTFLYDGSTNIWSEQQTGTGLINRYSGNLAIVFNGNVYVSDYSNGNIYQLSDEAFTDNGTPIMRLCQTRHIHDHGNMLAIDEMFLDMETGVGLQSGQGSTPQIMVSTSKDGGRTFGNERLMSLGAVGQYIGPRATLRRFGASRTFTFRIRMTDPVKWAITYGAAVTRGLGK
jgi:hypothetical protein